MKTPRKKRLGAPSHHIPATPLSWMKRAIVRKDRTLWTFIALGALALGAITWHLVDDALVDIIVRVPPDRAECLRWIEHLQAAGFRVEVEKDPTPEFTRRHAHVPDQLASCHTAITLQPGRYVLEGHVPADVIRRLLAERPAIYGLAVPGTPVGAPGLEGLHAEPYDIWAFTADGRTVKYAHRVPGNSGVDRLRERPPVELGH